MLTKCYSSQKVFHNPQGISKTLSGDPHCQNYFQINCEMLFAIFTVLIFVLMVQKTMVSKIAGAFSSVNASGQWHQTGHNTYCVLLNHVPTDRDKRYQFYLKMPLVRQEILTY